MDSDRWLTWDLAQKADVACASTSHTRSPRVLVTADEASLHTPDGWRDACAAWMREEQAAFVCPHGATPFRVRNAARLALMTACTAVVGVPVEMHYFVPATGADRRGRLLLCAPLGTWTALDRWCAAVAHATVSLVQEDLVGCWMVLDADGRLTAFTPEVTHA